MNRDQQTAKDAVRDVLAAEAAGKLADQSRPAPTRNRTDEQIAAAAEAVAAMDRLRL